MVNPHETKRIKQSLENWEQNTLASALKRAPERKDRFSTSSMDVNRVYTPLDLGQEDYMERVGLPGEYPFTRGVQSTMYRGQLWTMRQYAGIGTPKETNARFHTLLNEGQTGLSVAFDLPTQLGYDSDDPLALGEVGKVGVAIDSLRDMEVAFQGVPLDKVSTSMTINAPALILLAMYIAVAEKDGIPAEKLTGTVQNDVLKEYVARGTYIYPPKPSLRLAGNLIAYCAQKLPRWNPISISGYHIRDAGSTAAQEIAYTFANAIAYVDEVLRQGVPIDSFAPRISWIFNTHNHFLEEVAKYRALRRMWARLVRERYGAQDSRSLMFRTHTQTGGSTMTAQQPEINIARAAIQCLAAVFGGVQSIALSTYDEALAIPTDRAQRIALRIQQIIAHETGVADTIDPLAGSYAVEALTDDLESRAWAEMKLVEDLGGAIAAVESGYYQLGILDAAYAHQIAVEEGRTVVVGVNQYQIEEDQPTPIFRPDPRAYQDQMTSLETLRRERNDDQVRSALEKLRSGAMGTDNLMPYILQSVKAYATVGEISGVLREIFGDYTPPTAL